MMRSRSGVLQTHPFPHSSGCATSFDLGKYLHTSTSKQYTGRRKLKHMVQSRQFRKNRVDSHYASAGAGTCMKESFQSSIASTPLLFVKMTNILSKWENLDTPVAAVEHGKQVQVGLNEKMVVREVFFRVHRLFAMLLTEQDFGNRQHECHPIALHRWWSRPVEAQPPHEREGVGVVTPTGSA